MKTATVIKSLLLTSVFVVNCLAQAAQSGQAQSGQAASNPQEQALDLQIQMLRQDLRSQRKQVIAANMNLTDAEAEKFWPAYQQYVDELVKNNNTKYELIKQYLQADKLSDAEAETLSKRWIQVDESVVQLRLKYLPTFRQILSAKSTARFFQLDRRVQMMIDLQLASAIPLVQP
jgi:Spy/CpxP family protein refolding chaperone